MTAPNPAAVAARPATKAKATSATWKSGAYASRQGRVTRPSRWKTAGRAARARVRLTAQTCRWGVPGCARIFEIDADRELRAAYGAAVGAGARHRDLAAYRANWAQARRYGTRDPRRLVAIYRTMSRELRALAGDLRAGRT